MAHPAVSPVRSNQVVVGENFSRLKLQLTVVRVQPNRQLPIHQHAAFFLIIAHQVVIVYFPVHRVIRHPYFHGNRLFKTVIEAQLCMSAAANLSPNLLLGPVSDYAVQQILGFAGHQPSAQFLPGKLRLVHNTGPHTSFLQCDSGSCSRRSPSDNDDLIMHLLIVFDNFL